MSISVGSKDGGIRKKKPVKHMSRQQRLRHEKGLEMADRNLDRLEKKVAISRDKRKKIKERSVSDLFTAKHAGNAECYQ